MSGCAADDSLDVERVVAVGHAADLSVSSKTARLRVRRDRQAIGHASSARLPLIVALQPCGAAFSVGAGILGYKSEMPKPTGAYSYLFTSQRKFGY